jgi:hypothetical protein
MKTISNLSLNVLTSLLIFFILTAPHIFYMTTYKSNIYINDIGEVVSEVSAIGFTYSVYAIILCSIASAILGRVITKKLEN